MVQERLGRSLDVVGHSGMACWVRLIEYLDSTVTQKGVIILFLKSKGRTAASPSNAGGDVSLRGSKQEVRMGHRLT